jgi:hypothetical protein
MAKQDNSALLAELKLKHDGNIVHCTMKGGQLLVFRAPTLEEWEDYQGRLVKDRSKMGAANRELCQRTAVYPAPAADGSTPELQGAFERAPMLASQVTDQLGDLAAGAIEGTVKKG